MSTEAEFEGWAIVELMGHVRLGGYVRPATFAGQPLGRIDIPGEGEAKTTQFFSAGSIYRMTPTTEEVARAVAARNQPEPVSRWELPKLAAAPPDEDGDVDENGEYAELP